MVLSSCRIQVYFCLLYDNCKWLLFSLADIPSKSLLFSLLCVKLLFVSIFAMYCFWLTSYNLCPLWVVFFCHDPILFVSANIPLNVSSWANSKHIFPTKHRTLKINLLFPSLLCAWPIILHPGLLQQTIFFLLLASVHQSIVNFNPSLMLVSNPQTKHLGCLPFHSFPRFHCLCSIRISLQWGES